MKTIYATQDEAVNAIITQFGIGYRYAPVDGGFIVVPEQPTDEFLTGEQIPSEFRKKPTHNAIQTNTAPPIRQNKFIPDDESDYIELDLLKHVDDSHIMKRLAIANATAIQMPASSVFLAGLGVFSSISCRRYVVAYQHGGDVPTGLYIYIEQPSGAGKTWCLSPYQKPFFKAHEKRVKEYHREVERLKSIEDKTSEDAQDLKHLLEHPPQPLFSTNPTPESLEQLLNQTGGFFSIVSSEQGALDSMLGYAYKDGKSTNNNDLLLNGFDGGYINSMRVGRGGYCGHVAGAFVSFAQNGSIEKMIIASNGTGLAERGIFAAEPHYLGKRDHSKSTAISRELLDEYNNIASTLADLIHHQSNANLAVLNISEYGHKMITAFKQSIEPHLADGGKYSHSYLRGAASKLNIQIMKIAANLHLTSSIDAFHDNEIPDSYVDAAIEIVSELFDASVQICTKKGFVGERAELEALINYLSKDGGKAKTEKEITNSLRNTNPFKNYSGSRTQAAKKSFQRAIDSNFIVAINPLEKTPRYKIA